MEGADKSQKGCWQTVTFDTHSIIELDRQIEKRVREAGSSFYWAMRLLDAEKRRAMYAIYAFCREVDDIADGQDPETKKREDLNKWRSEIDQVYAGKPESVIGSALQSIIPRHQPQKVDFLAVIDGMEMDVPRHFQIIDRAELELYCDRVACAVGRLSNAICGIPPEHGDNLAKSLGEALQLTNILRDVAEDAKRNHVYLPEELLVKNGYAGGPPILATEDPAVARTCAEISEIANQRFNAAQIVLKKIGSKKTLAPRIMMTIYRKINDKLRDRGWDRLDHPVVLTKLDKAFLILKSSLT